MFKPSDLILPGQVDLFSTPSPHLLYKPDLLNVTNGVIPDANNNNASFLTFNTAGANNTVGPVSSVVTNQAPLLASDGIQFQANPGVNGDSFLAANSSVFSFHDPSRTSVYIFHFYKWDTANALPFSSNGTFLGCYDTTTGAAGSGFALGITSAGYPRGLLYDGATSTTVATLPATIGNPITDSTINTWAFVFDASINGFYAIAVAQDSLQYPTSAVQTPSAPVSYSSGTTIAAFGQRNSALVSDKLVGITMMGMECYEDATGGAVPEDLPFWIRWKHQNPDYPIPEVAWS